MGRVSWMLNAGEPYVVMPASELAKLIAGNDDVCVECSMEIAKQAEKILPHPWQDLVDDRVNETDAS